jgi:hypothetical protein
VAERPGKAIYIPVRGEQQRPFQSFAEESPRMLDARRIQQTAPFVESSTDRSFDCRAVVTRLRRVTRRDHGEEVIQAAVLRISSLEPPTSPSGRTKILGDPKSESAPGNPDPMTLSALHEKAFATSVVEAACPFQIDGGTLTIVGKRRKSKPCEFESELL